MLDGWDVLALFVVDDRAVRLEVMLGFLESKRVVPRVLFEAPGALLNAGMCIAEKGK